MLCPNKFLISTPFPLSNAPNSQNKFPTFRPKIKTRNFFHSPQAYNVDGSENSSRKTLSLPSNVETITSTSNPFVKHCVKLRQNSSYRHSHGLVLVVSSTPISSRLKPALCCCVFFFFSFSCFILVWCYSCCFFVCMIKCG
ncbi:hypothetical protein CDL12_03612 [Handroanthus impetiginosus]|uniref:Uncharacterized protein n=1 Tax=Handroanthus impetiginosus TaxID=429701 RepID=A0A2G9I1P6_9LAMI|nr:hypothetical protein CDL12_03612 [Handroanthus impetiginosus]